MLKKLRRAPRPNKRSFREKEKKEGIFPLFLRIYVFFFFTFCLKSDKKSL